MPLDSNSYILKIYSGEQLLIAKPCSTEEYANQWFEEYKSKQIFPNLDPKKLTAVVVPLPPRI